MIFFLAQGLSDTQESSVIDTITYLLSRFNEKKRKKFTGMPIYIKIDLQKFKKKNCLPGDCYGIEFKSNRKLMHIFALTRLRTLRKRFLVNLLAFFPQWMIEKGCNEIYK